VLLVAAALSALAHWRGLPEKKQPGLRIDPLLLGLLAFLLCGAAVAYNAVREAPVIRHWRQQYGLVLAASRQALSVTHSRERVYGALDLVCWPLSEPYNLPGATYSRLWLDDPRVSPQVGELLPRYGIEEVLGGATPLKSLVLWESFAGKPGHPREAQLLQRLPDSPYWREVPSDAEGARVWLRTDVEAPPSTATEEP